MLRKQIIKPAPSAPALILRPGGHRLHA